MYFIVKMLYKLLFDMFLVKINDLYYNKPLTMLFV